MLKKGYVIFAVVVSFIFAFWLLWVQEYPGKTSFNCYKSNNICELSYQNVFGHKFCDTVELDKIQKAVLEEQQEERSRSTRYTVRKYLVYVYSLNLYYNNSGKSDIFRIYKSTDYEYGPAGKYDREVEYYKDTVQEFNLFLKDNYQTNFRAYDYKGKNASNVWIDMIYVILLLPIMIFMLIIPISTSILVYLISFLGFERLSDFINNLIFK